MNRNITFKIGEEFVPVIEKDVERIKNTSLFTDIYTKVFKGINDFLKDNQESPRDPSKEVNNIFAFIGERGAGKSSCMQSVAHILSDQKLYTEAFNTNDQIYNTKFEKLDVIDPGMFENNNNILQLIVGKLFKTFKQEAESPHGDDNRLIKKRELITCFDQIYQNIRVLFNQGNADNESLDALLDLSASHDLKANFYKLIKLYLAWKNKTNGILILQIDDIDLQTLYAYDMVEQIRKYMMHPNIIILMAVRLSQLEEVITRQYVQEFQLLLNPSNGYMDKNAPVEMSERYLGKLIPHDRRLFLPEMEDLFTWPLTVADSDMREKKYPSVRHAVLELIFQKTRFLFYDTKGSTSYIVPRNLRELRSLIRLLYKMPAFRVQNTRGKVVQEHTYNQVLFQKYFFETWLQNNLDQSGIELVQNVWNAEIIVKHKLIIDYFCSRYIKKYENDIPYSVRYILTSSHKAYDISIGDVLGVLDTMETLLVAPNEQKLIFAIRTVYSLLLYRYYNLYAAKKEQENKKSETILKNELLENIPDYLKFAGGAFINSDLYSLLPDENHTQSRTRKNIDLTLLRRFVGDILTATPKPEEIEDPDDLALLNLLEFTLLNIIARNESPAKKIDTRSISNPSYLFSVSPKTHYFQFDILGFAYNLTQNSQIYARYLQLFGVSENTIERQRWATYLRQNRSSLYSRIRSIAKAKRSYKSMVCFRNCEVINSFVWHMLQNRPEGTRNNLSLYTTFYRRLGRFRIDTYDNNSIEFSFIEQIAEVLDGITEERTPTAYNMFNTLFFPPQPSPSPSTLNINIRLNQKNKNRYDEILKKLKEKNSGIEFETLFTQAFPEQRSYDSQEAKQQLQSMKQHYENRTSEDNG